MNAFAWREGRTATRGGGSPFGRVGGGQGSSGGDGDAAGAEPRGQRRPGLRRLRPQGGAPAESAELRPEQGQARRDAGDVAHSGVTEGQHRGVGPCHAPQPPGGCRRPSVSADSGLVSALKGFLVCFFTEQRSQFPRFSMPGRRPWEMRCSGDTSRLP